MKYISKKFESIKKAESYQNRLYGKYNHVKLLTFPRFSESGIYVWEVKA
jgi:hypothetical protein